MNTPINLNISEIKKKFEEVYPGKEEAYLFSAYYLGYSANLLSKTPDLSIPGHDPLLVVAAHLGKVQCRIEKENKLYLEKCNSDKVPIIKHTTSQVSESTAEWY